MDSCLHGSVLPPIAVPAAPVREQAMRNSRIMATCVKPHHSLMPKLAAPASEQIHALKVRIQRPTKAHICASKKRRSGGNAGEAGGKGGGPIPQRSRRMVARHAPHG